MGGFENDKRKKKAKDGYSQQGGYEDLRFWIQRLEDVITKQFEAHQQSETMSNNLIGMQISALNGELESRLKKTMTAVSQEIRFSYKQNQTIYDSLSKTISKDLVEKLQAIETMLAALEQLQSLATKLEEVRLNGLQTQASCDAISALVSGEVNPKLDALSEKQAKLDEIQNVLAEVNAKLEGFLPTEEDYNKLVESINEKTQEANAQVLDAIAAIPAAENVDYNRIVVEVGDKVLDLLNEIKGTDEEKVPAGPVEAKIDYDRIIYGAAEKVIESLPYPEKVDYNRIEEMLAKATAPEVDYERLAELVASKIAAPEAPAAPEIDYDRLASLVVEKMTAGAEQTCDVVLDEAGINEIADKVAAKLEIDYDKVGQAAQAAQVQPEAVNYDRIAEIVEEKLSAEEPTYDLVLDAEGLDAIAKGVAEQLCAVCVPCEAPVEEAVEEVVEEVVEEAPVEEAVVEEVVEEAPVEEPVAEVVEEAPVVEELAVAAEPVYEEIDNQLVDAETGLVIRLKKSFTAKMKQSDEKVKEYYSDIKNELTSYKRLNSNVSWHGDRFNYGRDTVAKINISGKTLCFYLALDPNDPEYKTTVYHQRDVSAQKAYENTPFMVKVKSDAAAKKALRLVGYLAEKIGAEKETNFEPVNYVDEFGYESTKQLFDTGFIKATKEKKVDFDF